jgi:hypothetical protein
MGDLTYGNTGLSFWLDDRTLAHLEVVIAEKFSHTIPIHLEYSDPGADCNARIDREPWPGYVAPTSPSPVRGTSRPMRKDARG